MSRAPPSCFSSSSPSSSGLLGLRPPSYHVNLTGGMEPRGEFVERHCGAGVRGAVEGSRDGFDAGGKAEVERPHGVVDQVSTHIADGADAPIGPAAPIEGVIDGVVVHVGSAGTLKKIPGEATGDGVIAAEGCGKARVNVAAAPFERFGPGLQRGRARDALRPIAEGAIGPDVDLAHIANRVGPDILDRSTAIVGGVTLVAHLG